MWVLDFEFVFGIQDWISGSVDAESPPTGLLFQAKHSAGQDRASNVNSGHLLARAQYGSRRADLERMQGGLSEDDMARKEDIAAYTCGWKVSGVCTVC